MAHLKAPRLELARNELARRG